MTKTQLKLMAQDHILTGIQTAFYRINDNRDLTEDEKQTMTDEVSHQMARVEKLFGYEVNSWMRG